MTPKSTISEQGKKIDYPILNPSRTLENLKIPSKPEAHFRGRTWACFVFSDTLGVGRDFLRKILKKQKHAAELILFCGVPVFQWSMLY